MTATSGNYINEEIMSRLNSGIDCQQLFQNLWFSHFLSININIKLYKAISLILPAVLYGWNTWHFSL